MAESVSPGRPMSGAPVPPAPDTQTLPPAPTLTDLDLLRRATAAANGATFERLWHGAWDGAYPSQSEADLALCAILAFWTGRDASWIDRLFRLSGLYRPKWDARHFADGQTYGTRTVAVAVARVPSVWSPSFSSTPRASSGSRRSRSIGGLAPDTEWRT